MKKALQNKRALLFITTAAVMSTVVFGCGKKDSLDKEAPNPVENVGTTISEALEKDPTKDLPPELAHITKEQIEACPTAAEIKETMTKNEFLDMSEDALKVFIAKNAPNFRKIFAIDDSVVMGPEEWEEVKILACYQIYGSFSRDRDPQETSATSEGDLEVLETEADDTVSMAALIDEDRDDILDMTAEEIAALSYADFITYGDALLEAFGFTDANTGETMSLASWDTEDVEEFRQILMDACLPGKTLRESDEESELVEIDDGNVVDVEEGVPTE